MSNLTLRATKGSPLTFTEMDANFTGLASDITSAAGTAKSEAIAAAATDATTKANTAKSEAIAAVTNGAGAAFDTLKEIQDAMATDAELAAAITAVASSSAAAAATDAAAKVLVEKTRAETAEALLAPKASPTFTGTVSGITKSMVGLGNVDNTADTAKPVSTTQQTALNLKADLASPTFTGTVSGITKTMVGLGSVDNTTDTAKPVSTAQQTALNLKANLASPTFTGTVSGITKTMVGLGNVDNTADTSKPVSTAQQAAINTAISGLTLSNISGNLPVSKLDGGTNASATTYLRGDGTWAAVSGGGGSSSPATPTVKGTVYGNTSTTKTGIGYSAIASDCNSTVIGSNSNSGICAVAIGYNTSAGYYSSIAIGNNSATNGIFSTAIGSYSIAGCFGVAIGFGTSTRSSSVAIGSFTQTNPCSYTYTAVGSGVSITGSCSVGIGAYSTAGRCSVVIGNNATSGLNNMGAIAIGKFASAANFTPSIAIGKCAKLGCFANAIVIGNSSDALLCGSHGYAVVIGSNLSTAQDGFYTNAIRDIGIAGVTNGVGLGYCTSRKEIVYGFVGAAAEPTGITWLTTTSTYQGMTTIKYPIEATTSGNKVYAAFYAGSRDIYFNWLTPPSTDWNVVWMPSGWIVYSADASPTLSTAPWNFSNESHMIYTTWVVNGSLPVMITSNNYGSYSTTFSYYLSGMYYKTDTVLLGSPLSYLNMTTALITAPSGYTAKGSKQHPLDSNLSVIIYQNPTPNTDIEVNWTVSNNYWPYSYIQVPSM